MTLFDKQEFHSTQPARSPVVAALLSALWSGLGHIYCGRYLAGLVLAGLYLGSLLSTVLFYGYITTPLLWLLGIVTSVVLARRPQSAQARQRQMKLAVALLAVVALVSVARAIWLRGQRGDVRPVSASVASSSAEPSVLSDTAAAHLQYLLDLALQPVDDWSGWKSVDPFGQTALRYQIAFVGYALAQAQFLHLPAYEGPIKKALDNLIQRMLDKRVWGYWRTENLWGNWNANPDPVAKNNVMYSGHLANLIGLYEFLFGDHKYDQPGAITFRWSETERFSYDHLTLVRRLYEQLRDNPHHSIACEPHQVFLMCNDHAILSLLLADRVHGTSFAAVVPSFVNAVRRIFTGDDLHFRYPYYEGLGVTLPLTLAVGDAWSLAFTHPFAAALTERMYPSFVRRFVRWREDGSAKVRGTVFEVMDIGNYRPSSLSPTAFGLVLAKEMGDSHLATALWRTLEKEGAAEFAAGRRHFRKLSLLLNAVITLGLVNEADGLRRLYDRSLDLTLVQAPRLASVRGQVQVRGAHFDPDTAELRFTLCPCGGETSATIAIAGLEAGRKVRVLVAGATPGGSPSELELRADAQGTAEWAETLDRETHFILRSVGS